MQGLPQSSFSLWFSLGCSCFSSSLLLSSPSFSPLCRMSDPVSAAPLPAWERHEALRHKQNTDKNTRRAMCRPVSQNSPNSLSLTLSPFSIHLVSLCLSFIHTHTHTHTRTHKLSVQRKRQQSAGSTDTPVAVGIITLVLSP